MAIWAPSLTIRVEDSRLREVHCANQTLESEFWNYCTPTIQRPRRRVRHRTNIGVHDVIGNILQDERFRAFTSLRQSLRRAYRRRLVLRDPYRRGGPAVHIWIDGTQIMQGGAFLFDTSLRQQFNRSGRRKVPAFSN